VGDPQLVKILPVRPALDRRGQDPSSAGWSIAAAPLIAGKHQSMLDVIAPFAVLPDNCFIMKKELAPLPFFGWFPPRQDDRRRPLRPFKA
jgi:1-acyl-sn-glycerol-3-phosphate acyltransferase